MKIIALQTARAGSKSVANKNITIVNGKPLYEHNISCALKSKYIEKIFISTDCEYILNNKIENINYIRRPEELSRDHSSHHDVMKHGVNFIEEQSNKKIEYFVLLLGNSIIRDYTKIDQAIEILNDKPEYDSVVTVSEFNMFNPYRAFKIENDYLKNFMNNFQTYDNITSNDKNAFGSFYYLNGEFQVMRRKTVMSEGPAPFRWMGNNIYPMVLKNNMEVDSQWQLEYLRSII